MNVGNIVGISVGAGAGMLLGRYSIYPLWQGKQTNVEKATSKTWPMVFMVGTGIVGAGLGLLAAMRIAKDARETRPRKTSTRREQSVAQYYPMFDDGQIPVLVIQHERGDADYDGNYTLIFPTEAADYSGKTATSWDTLSGHGAASKGYATGKKRASAAKAKELLGKYCAGYDCSVTDYKIVTTWDASYDGKRRKAAQTMSDPACPPRRKTKRTRRTIGREKVKVGNKTVTVSVSRRI